MYKFLAELGSMFTNFDGPIVVPIGNEILSAWRPNRMIFDNLEKRWIPYTKEFLESLPRTCTFVPKSTTTEMEMDYFVRACGLPKHVFIWSTNGIDRENFAWIKSGRNMEYRGRYTFTPNLPNISTLGRMEGHFYVMEICDWDIIFGQK